MRVLFDALGSTSQSGGMRLHSTTFVAAWSRAYPADEIHLLAPKWAKTETSLNSVVLHTWPNESIVMRAPGQLVVAALLVRRVSADVVISLSPIVTPLTHTPRIAFQHDWRHIKNPREFGRAQHIYRRLWRASSQWADLNACISEKTITETLALSHSAKVALVPNGHDEATMWEHRSQSQVAGQIVTFGHHNNKRPDLLIRSLPLLPRTLRASLIVLGARDAYREELVTLATSLGVREQVSFPGFVEQSEYQRIVSSSSLVALVSSDEGFGLPIAEAMCLGIPALVTSDSGISEIFPDYPFLADPTPPAIATAIREALTADSRRPPRVAHTWSASVDNLRSRVVQLLDTH